MKPIASYIKTFPPRLSWVLIITLAAVVVFPMLLLFGTTEPRYQGKPLTFWLKDWSNAPKPGSSSAALHEWAMKRHEAEKVIRVLGLNSIPTLMRMLRARDSWLKVQLTRNKAVQWVANGNVLSGYLEPACKKNRTAAQGLSLLGQDGKEAVPDLIKALEDNPDEESRRCAAACLGSMGPAAEASVPAMTRAAILERNNYFRSTARSALVSIGPARTNGLMVAWPYRNSTNAAINMAFQMTIDIVDPERIYGRGTLLAELGAAPNAALPHR